MTGCFGLSGDFDDLVARLDGIENGVSQSIIDLQNEDISLDALITNG